MSQRRQDVTTIWLVGALLLAACSRTEGTLQLLVSAPEGTPALTALQAYAKPRQESLGEGWAFPSQPGRLAFAPPRDLHDEPFRLVIAVGDGGPTAAVDVVVLAYDGDTPTHSWQGDVDPLADREYDATLVAIVAGCDIDADGFKDCEPKVCCNEVEQEGPFVDCDDGLAAAHPLAGQDECRTCVDTDGDKVSDCEELAHQPSSCDINEASAYPGAPERCDDVDNDCDGLTDEEVTCDDGDLCNGVSTCVAGACQQTTPPVTCAAPDECHTASCIPGTGLCMAQEGNEGLACEEDGDACNGMSTCVSGACQQTTPPVTCVAPDECHNASCNPWTGLCGVQADNEGLACDDDGNACNGVKTCVAGSCLQTTSPITCSALDECHLPGSCDAATGACSDPVGNEGKTCQDDQNACNGVSTCVAGSCLQTTPSVTCTALDECHLPGSCNPATGKCGNPSGNEGEICQDDQNACNGVSTCIAGSCQQTTPPVTCAALDECHLTGYCNPATGKCTNPSGNEGAVCEHDGDRCNGVSTCLSGACQQTTPPITCKAKDACHLPGTCYPPTGICSNPSKSCNDDDPCTEDSCVPAAGCCYEKRNCDDGLAETHDWCDPNSGQCQHDTATTGFVRVAPGSFWMGSPGGQTCPVDYPGGGCPEAGLAAAEPGRDPDEALHFVGLSRYLEFQSEETSQGDWLSIFPDWNPAYLNACGESCPATAVSWFDALAYANQRSIARGLPACYVLSGITCTDGSTPADVTDCMTVTRGGIQAATTAALNGFASPYLCRGYRLPTETEWEYVVRAGSVSAFYPTAWSDGGFQPSALGDCEEVEPSLAAIAWYCATSASQIHACSSLEPNAWGLFDLAGNAREWCWDGYGSYGAGTPSQPLVDPVRNTAASRVVRGGGWSSYAKATRSAARESEPPGSRDSTLGFRLVRTL